MPISYIKKLSQYMSIPVSTLEEHWDQAKGIISKKMPEEDPKYWPYVTSVFKNMVGISTSKEFPEWWVKLGPTGQDRYLKTKKNSKLKKTFDKRGRLLKGVVVVKGGKVVKSPSTPKDGSSTPSEQPKQSSKPKAEEVHEDDVDTLPQEETTPAPEPVSEEQQVENEIHDSVKEEPKLEIKPVVKKDRPPRTFYEKAKAALKIHKRSLKRGLGEFSKTHTEGAKAIGKIAMGIKLNDEEKEHAKKTTSLLVTGLLGAAALGALAFAGPGLSALIADKFLNHMQARSENSESAGQRDPMHSYVDNLTSWLESVDLEQVAEEAAAKQKAGLEENGVKNDSNA